MNIETKLRTAFVIVTSLNTALMATDITQFHNSTIDSVYTWLSIILQFVSIALATYFNNDYTIEGAIGTKKTRDLKELRNVMPPDEGDNDY